MKPRFPRPLPKNATIGIVSPASPQRDPERLVRGVAHLRRLGHRVIVGDSCVARHGGYLAGTDELRSRELEMMFADTSVDAIMCARGGYGSARLLEMIDWSVIRANPKIFVGFSDTTALQMAMLKKTGLVTFSGAMPSVDMADGFHALSAASLWDVLTNTKVLGKLQQPTPLSVLRPGSAEGILVGGNLSVLVTLLGTPWMPTMDGAVLVLEDVGEETYRIDRMLNHLRQAGVLDRIGALVFGQWSQNTERSSNTPHRDVNEVLREYASFVNGPVLSDLMFGHESPKLTIPMGVRAKVSSRSASVSILESAVRA